MRFLTILPTDFGGLSHAQHRESLELFQSDIAPVLRKEIPDPPWGWEPVVGSPAPVTIREGVAV